MYELNVDEKGHCTRTNQNGETETIITSARGTAENLARQTLFAPDFAKWSSDLEKFKSGEFDLQITEHTFAVGNLMSDLYAAEKMKVAYEHLTPKEFAFYNKVVEFQKILKVMDDDCFSLSGALEGEDETNARGRILLCTTIGNMADFSPYWNLVDRFAEHHDAKVEVIGIVDNWKSVFISVNCASLLAEQFKTKMHQFQRLLRNLNKLDD